MIKLLQKIFFLALLLIFTPGVNLDAAKKRAHINALPFTLKRYVGSFLSQEDVQNFSVSSHASRDDAIDILISQIILPYATTSEKDYEAQSLIARAILKKKITIQNETITLDESGTYRISRFMAQAAHIAVDGTLSLCQAIKARNFFAVLTALDRGADLSEVMDDEYGFGPLETACRFAEKTYFCSDRYDTSITRLLLNADKNDNLTANDKAQALAAACSHLDINNIKLLLKHSTNGLDNGLRIACSAMCEKRYIKFLYPIVELLLHTGANPNSISNNEYRYTALHRVCEQRDSAEEKEKATLIKLLLQNGADVNALAIYDRSPLYDAACQWGNVSATKELLKYGAVVTPKILSRTGNAKIREILENHLMGTEDKSDATTSAAVDLEAAE